MFPDLYGLDMAKKYANNMIGMHTILSFQETM